MAAAKLLVEMTGFTALISNFKDFVTVAPALAALTVTVKVPDFVGVPVIRPEAYFKPAGRPLTVTVGVGFPVTVTVAL